MSKPKASDSQIIDAIVELQAERKREWKTRFGLNATPFYGFRREEIQQQVEALYGIQYSDSGFRGRLKQLVGAGLKRFRLYPRIVFYFLQWDELE